MLCVLSILLSGVAWAAWIAPDGSGFADEPSTAQRQLVVTKLSSMPLSFIENQGQFGEKTKFRCNAFGASFYFAAGEVAYLFSRQSDELIEEPMGHLADMPDKLRRPRYKREGLLVRARFVGANPDAEVVGEGMLPHKCNYFLGNDPSKWRTDVPNYSAVRYRDIYSGIDLRYYGDGHSLKYDFIVKPGADPSLIKIEYDEVNSLSVNPKGELVVATEFGDVIERVPYVCQEIDGDKREVPCGYVILDGDRFGFGLDEGYDRAQQLFIDPELVYSTYLGGSSNDYGYAIAVDGEGCVYMTGYTESSDFPTASPYDGSFDGCCDVFVTKLSASGGTLIYSTYLGGIGPDYGYSIAVDGEGLAYVTGFTDTFDFPTVNPYQANNNGDMDAFVTKLSASGSSLTYSTYLGGSYSDFGIGIAVDGSGCIYVTGSTISSDFPTVNAYDGSFNGGEYDVFITKLSASGSELGYSTYLGGSDGDYGYSIAVDDGGSAYVTGDSQSPDFPTVSPYQGNNNGIVNAFITKLSALGSELGYSTYLGGSFVDRGRGITVDDGDCAYVTGLTASTDFPMANPYDGSYNGNCDVFVAKFSTSGSFLLCSTYLGGCYGGGFDHGDDIAVDGEGFAYVTGFTEFTDFPTVNPYQSDFGGGNGDAFVVKYLGEGECGDIGFRPNPHGWQFANTGDNMWPYDWWPWDPWDERCLKCFPKPTRCFPTWELFTEAFGSNQTEFANGKRRPHADTLWKSLKGCWQGSCFGFATSSFLFFDGYLDISTEFPGYSQLYLVPLSDENRLMINKYWIYQFGKVQQKHIDANYNSTTPSQTLQACKAMFNSSTRNDRILLMHNNHGGGGHAVTPYRCEVDPYISAITYVYVYDSNHPGEEWKIVINTENSTWSYSGTPGWGGGKHLFLSDPMSNYTTDPILPTSIPPRDRWISEKTAIASQFVEFYISTTDTTLFESSAGSIGRIGDSLFTTLSEGHPIIPITGQETLPIGYYLPNDAWTCRFSGITDSSFHLSLFTDSTVLVYSRTDADSTQSENFRYPGNDSTLWVGNPDPSTRPYDLAVISVAPDSEIVCGIHNISIDQNDSACYSITPLSGLQVDNYGGQKTYDLQVEVASDNVDTVFFHGNIALSGTTSHQIIPDWRQNGDTLIILVDEGMDGNFSDTIWVANEGVPVATGEPKILPTEFSLEQNYPNPFNSTTQIKYSLPRNCWVRLEVYNILGQKVASLVDGKQKAGYETVRWDAGSLSSGIYFYRLKVIGDRLKVEKTRKMILLR